MSAFPVRTNQYLQNRSTATDVGYPSNTTPQARLNDLRGPAHRTDGSAFLAASLSEMTLTGTSTTQAAESSSMSFVSRNPEYSASPPLTGEATPRTSCRMEDPAHVASSSAVSSATRKITPVSRKSEKSRRNLSWRNSSRKSGRKSGRKSWRKF